MLTWPNQYSVLVKRLLHLRDTLYCVPLGFLVKQFGFSARLAGYQFIVFPSCATAPAVERVWPQCSVLGFPPSLIIILHQFFFLLL